ncbi:hypothetical protein MHYP_G00058600 [Metynnis hypsauchen]
MMLSRCVALQAGPKLLQPARPRRYSPSIRLHLLAETVPTQGELRKTSGPQRCPVKTLVQLPGWESLLRFFARACREFNVKSGDEESWSTWERRRGHYV